MTALVVRAPGWPVKAAAVSTGITLALAAIAVWRPAIALSAAGYAVAAVVVPGLVVVHRAKAQAVARNPWVSPRPALDRTAALVMSTALAVCLWHAWALATEVARR